MKLSILHLSDLHTKNSEDHVLSRARDIASAHYEYTRNSDATLIIVSGDLAYSGHKDEYQLVANFLKTIADTLQGETDTPIYIIAAPGNHDCDFSKSQSVRNAILDTIISDPSKIDEEIIDTCTAVQEDFFAFQDSICNADSPYSHKLWKEYEINIGAKNIRISAINAAWFSCRKETQGKLIFPAELFQDVASEPSTLRIALIHHPLNWYAQSSHHTLKKMLRTHTDIVMSGHEHTENSGTINDSNNGTIVYFEAPALAPHDTTIPGSFTSLLINLEEREITENSISLLANGGTKTDTERRHAFSPGTTKSGNGILDLQDNFSNVLRDPGGNFSHPIKDHIEFDDIFQYPDIEEVVPGIRTGC